MSNDTEVDAAEPTQQQFEEALSQVMSRITGAWSGNLRVMGRALLSVMGLKVAAVAGILNRVFSAEQQHLPLNEALLGAAHDEGYGEDVAIRALVLYEEIINEEAEKDSESIFGRLG